LRFVQRRLDEAKKEGARNDRGARFVDAARRVHELARKAFDDKDYSRAVNLAWGAEAWSHVPEHLMQAERPARRAAEPGRRDRGEAPENRSDRSPPGRAPGTAR
jgi:hypothetical protein